MDNNLLTSTNSNLHSLHGEKLNVICRRDIQIEAHQFKRINSIHLLSSGQDGFHVPRSWKGRVTSSSGVNSRAIAEYILCALLLDAKHIVQVFSNQIKHSWHREWCLELKGKKVLLVGYGNIAKEFIRLSSGFDMEIKIANRTCYNGEMIELRDVVQVAQNFDVVVSTLPACADTNDFFNHRFFEVFSKGLFINVSRGSVVDEDQLISWLQKDSLNRRAILDVYVQEPLDQASKLWELPNVLCTPHIAGTTNYFMENLFEILKNIYD